MQDWTDFVMAEQRSAAVHALAQKYKVQSHGIRQMSDCAADARDCCC